MQQPIATIQHSPISITHQSFVFSQMRLAKPKSSTQEINHELPANPGCKEKMSNRDLQVQNAATTSQHFAISNLHYSLIISFRATSPH